MEFRIAEYSLDRSSWPGKPRVSQRSVADESRNTRICRLPSGPCRRLSRHVPATVQRFLRVSRRRRLLEAALVSRVRNRSRRDAIVRSDCPERKGATLGESGVTKQARAAHSYKWLVFSASFANSAVKIFKAFNRKVA